MNRIENNQASKEDTGGTTEMVEQDLKLCIATDAAQDNDLWTANGNYATEYGGGDGSPNNPYRIKTAAQLARISQRVCDEGKDKDCNFHLDENIDLSAHLWKPIGHDDQIFTGSLHGGHKTIYGMRIDMTGLPNKWLNLGLFGRTDDAWIYSLNLVNISIRGNQYNNQSIQAGGIVGQAVNTDIYHCTVQGDEINVRFCYNEKGNSVAGIYAGGIVGRFNANIQSWGSRVYCCVSYVNKVIADTAKNIEDIHVGGLVGQGGWSGEYGVGISFTVSDVGKATTAKNPALGAVIGFSNLNSNYSKELYFLDTANARPVGAYFHSAHEIETIMVDESGMKNKMSEKFSEAMGWGWCIPEEVNNGFAFIGKIYTVTFKNDFEGSSSEREAAYGYPMVMPPDPEIDGWIFKGWCYGERQYKAGDIYFFSESIQLDAKMEAIFVEVIFDRQGGIGGTGSIAAQTGKAMPPIELPTNAGYSFSGYFTERNGYGTMYYNADGTSAHICNLNAGTMLYANWWPLTSHVILEKEGGTGGTDRINVAGGEAMPTIEVPIRTGYVFTGYYTEQNGGGTKYYNANGTSAHICELNADTTLYASWSPLTCQVLLQKEGGTGGTATVTAKYDSKLEDIAIPTRLGYQFSGYYLYPDGEGAQYYKSNGQSDIIWDRTCDTVLYAYWTENIGTEIKTVVNCSDAIFRTKGHYPAEIMATVHFLIPEVEFTAEWIRDKETSPIKAEDFQLNSNSENKCNLQLFVVQQSGTYTLTIYPRINGEAFKSLSSDSIALTVSQAPISFVASNLVHYYDGTRKTATVTQTPKQEPVIYMGYDVIYKSGGSTYNSEGLIEVGEYDILICLKNQQFKFEGVSESVREMSIGTLQILPASAGIENLHWSGADNNPERAIALWDKDNGATRYTVQLLKDGSPIVLTEDMLPEGASLLNGSIITETNSVNLSKAITEAGNFSFTVVHCSDSTEAPEEPAVSPVLKALAEVEKAGWKDSTTLSWSAVEGADYYVIQLLEEDVPVVIIGDIPSGITVLNSDCGLFKVENVTEIEATTLLFNVFNDCTYTILPGSVNPNHYIPVTYIPVRSDARP